MKVYLKSPATISVNGKKIEYPCGVQEIKDDHARILISAGKADSLSEEKPAGKKGSTPASDNQTPAAK